MENGLNLSGTGVVALNMKFKEAILNDTNPHIIRLYQEIKDDILTPDYRPQIL
jgi:DNA adenine methylase